MDLLEEGTLTQAREKRYSGWKGDLGTYIMSNEASLEGIADRVLEEGIDPQPTSGRQEALENLVNRTIWSNSA
jgi:xylose isomerase